VLTVITHIAECLAEVSPGCIAAWNGRMRCTAGGDQADQKHNAMVETAHQLYEAPSQRGAPALTMMDNILRGMLPMNFSAFASCPRNPPRLAMLSPAPPDRSRT
jgi:hypothetical protein